MKITAISIFPEYFDVLALSLIGKALANKRFSFKAVNLRDFTDDIHHSVDDSPYGGGAGMVMTAEPWGRAIDSEIKSRSSESSIIDLVILTPAGQRFDQQLARQMSEAEEIIFACGRYEGIDARVSDYYSQRPGIRLREISIGDYVLNGGEVAAIVMIEAIVRLLPGVLGNPESLNEESHNEIGELEYPVFTKPMVWREIPVPEVLLSGNHAEIARWRKDAQKRRGIRE